MIPKIIHYCWFGNGEIPDKDKKCIDSWRKYCPEYEVRQWGEENYDVTKNQYMYNAYQEKKWGFVPDYARFDIIYTHGGFYLDTDVELVKSLDELRDNKAYMGFESGEWVNGGIGFGAERGNETIKELRDMYETISFYKSDGTLELTPSPHYITGFLVKNGLRCDNSMQMIENLRVYPTDYFAAKDYYTGVTKKTKNTVSIHQYHASWQSPHRKRMHKIRRLIGNSNYNRLLQIKNYISGKK